MKRAFRVAWRVFLTVGAYLAVAIVLINLQPVETYNPERLGRFVERVAFGIVAGIITYRLIYPHASDKDGSET